MSLARRFGGTLLGASLTAVLLGGLVVGGFLFLRMRRDADRRRAQADLDESRARALAQASAASTPPTTTTPTTSPFAGFAATVAALAADPPARVTSPPIKLANGDWVASYDVPGCTSADLVWDPKTKDAWGMTALCAGLTPADLAPSGGVDAIDASYFVITAGPLAGVFVDRNLLDPSIWRIATVAQRMKGDASMFVFCAEKRVPGRTFLASSDFLDRCQSLIRAKMSGHELCKFDPPEGTSGYDCSRTWTTTATCEREVFDENKLTRRFTCTYDAKTPKLSLEAAAKPKP